MLNVNEELRSIYEMARELKLKSDVREYVDQSENEMLFDSIKTFAQLNQKITESFDLEISLWGLFDTCNTAVDVDDIEGFWKVLELTHHNDELAGFIVSLCPELNIQETMITGIESVLAGSISMNKNMRTKFFAELGLLLERFHVLDPVKYDELIKNAPQGI